MDTTRELRRFLIVTGAVLTAVGSGHLVLGARPYGGGGPALDSDLRFGGAATLVVAAVWFYCARQPEPPLGLVRVVAVGLLAGGAARWLSVLVSGVPGPLTLAQGAVEVVVPLFVLALTRNQAKQIRGV